MTDHEKQFVFLPKNVLLNATNFKELVCATPSKLKPENLVDEMFGQLPQIGNWIPALSNLKFQECSNAKASDESDAEYDIPLKFLSTEFVAPRSSSRKRKVTILFQMQKNYEVAYQLNFRPLDMMTMMR